MGGNSNGESRKTDKVKKAAVDIIASARPNTRKSLVGVIASESPTSIILGQPFGKEETVLRSKLKRMQNLGKSLMPEGLEAGLTPSQMADLLEFIETLK